MNFDEDLVLSEEQLEHLADLIATKIVAMRPASKPMLTVEEIASTFRVSRDWVYSNARRLGAIKIGPGERAPLRFDPDTVAAAMRRVGEDPPGNSTADPLDRKPSRKRPRNLLPVYDG